MTGTPPPIVRARGLTRRFGGLLAVSDVDLSLHEGRVLALIGPNGAGKSTTVNLLSGVLAPSSGRVELAGRDITGLPAHTAARAGPASTFQNGRLFKRLSVLDNVLVGGHAGCTVGFFASLLRSPAFRREAEALRERALTLLSHLGLADDAQRDVQTLPYGRQRKVEIARALMLQPRVLVLDEPAAGLNSGEVEDLIAYVQRLRADGLGILLIEHNMGLVMRLADRIAVLNFGQLIADGTPADVRSNPTVVEAYLGRSKAAGAGTAASGPGHAPTPSHAIPAGQAAA